jgi:hypothetical protein
VRQQLKGQLQRGNQRHPLLFVAPGRPAIQAAHRLMWVLETT